MLSNPSCGVHFRMDTDKQNTSYVITPPVPLKGQLKFHITLGSRFNTISKRGENEINFRMETAFSHVKETLGHPDSQDMNVSRSSSNVISAFSSSVWVVCRHSDFKKKNQCGTTLHNSIQYSYKHQKTNFVNAQLFDLGAGKRLSIFISSQPQSLVCEQTLFWERERRGLSRRHWSIPSKHRHAKRTLVRI